MRATRRLRREPQWVQAHSLARMISIEGGALRSGRSPFFLFATESAFANF